jgi:hypothetical protein
MRGELLAVIEVIEQGKRQIKLAWRFSGCWFIIHEDEEDEAGISKRMKNFIKKKRHEIERIEFYSKHPNAIRRCKHGHMMDITHRTCRKLKTDEYFCCCLLCGCEGGHSKYIDEAVGLWNELGPIDGEEGHNDA